MYIFFQDLRIQWNIMALSVRHTTIAVGSILTVFFLVCYSLCLALLFRTGGKGSVWVPFTELPAPFRDFVSGKASPEQTNLIWNFLGTAAWLAVGTVSGLLLRRLYVRTASPEIFFFLFFIFSMSFEALRGVNAVLILNEAPDLIVRILTRCVNFGRFFGLLSLLFSSLYAVGTGFQRFGIIILSTFSLAVTLAYSLPLHRTLLQANFLFRLGDESGVWFSVLAIKILILLDYLIAALKRQKAVYILIMAAVLLLLMGREILLVFSSPPRIAFAVGASILGIAAFGRITGRVYQWG